jgi:hypothetical protein
METFRVRMTVNSSFFSECNVNPSRVFFASLSSFVVCFISTLTHSQPRYVCFVLFLIFSSLLQSFFCFFSLLFTQDIVRVKATSYKRVEKIDFQMKINVFSLFFLQPNVSVAFRNEIIYFIS